MVDPWQSHQDEVTCWILWMRNKIAEDGDGPYHPLWHEIREFERLLETQ